MTRPIMLFHDTVFVGLGGAGSQVVTRCPADKKQILFLLTDKNGLPYKDNRFPRLLIGEKRLQGNGAGRDTTQGKKSIDESWVDIFKAVTFADHVVIVAGAAGGTGGAGPYLAQRLLKAEKIVSLCLISAFRSFESGAILKNSLNAVKEARAIENQLTNLIIFYPESEPGLLENTTFFNEYLNLVADHVLGRMLDFLEKRK